MSWKQKCHEIRSKYTYIYTHHIDNMRENHIDYICGLISSQVDNTLELQNIRYALNSDITFNMRLFLHTLSKLNGNLFPFIYENEILDDTSTIDINKGGFGRIIPIISDSGDYVKKTVEINRNIILHVANEIIISQYLSSTDCSMNIIPNSGVTVDSITQVSLYMKQKAPYDITIDRNITRMFLKKSLNLIHQKGIIHNDVKKDNILVDDDKLLLCDFGLSRVLGNPIPYCGTRGYIIPFSYYFEYYSKIFPFWKDYYAALVCVLESDRSDEHSKIYIYGKFYYSKPVVKQKQFTILCQLLKVAVTNQNITEYNVLASFYRYFICMILRFNNYMLETFDDNEFIYIHNPHEVEEKYFSKYVTNDSLLDDELKDDLEEKLYHYFA